jgi:DNA polymerase I-like protein with 3'-5' exonuclease and polymerase domains
MEPILDTNNSHDDKIRKANKLIEKKIIGVKETLERQGIEWNLHTLQN